MFIILIYAFTTEQTLKFDTYGKLYARQYSTYYLKSIWDVSIG